MTESEWQADRKRISALEATLKQARELIEQARELIEEVASQCPEENDWLDVANRWLAAEIAREAVV